MRQPKYDASVMATDPELCALMADNVRVFLGAINHGDDWEVDNTWGPTPQFLLSHDDWVFVIDANPDGPGWVLVAQFHGGRYPDTLSAEWELGPYPEVKAAQLAALEFWGRHEHSWRIEERIIEDVERATGG